MLKRDRDNEPLTAHDVAGRFFDWLEECDRRLKRERAACAAYLLDRAEQYDQGSGIVAALGECAANIAIGEHAEAAAHGELEELMPRVRRMRGNSEEGR